MSTKAIREALELLRKESPVDSPRRKASAAALAEVEAIERAAKDYRDNPQEMRMDSMETLERIAKEAP